MNDAPRGVRRSASNAVLGGEFRRRGLGAASREVLVEFEGVFERTCALVLWDISPPYPSPMPALGYSGPAIANAIS